MSEGEGHVLFARNEKKLIETFERNRSQCGALLAKIYVTAQAWAKQKGISLKDVEITDWEMSPNNKQYSFRLVKAKDLQDDTKTNTDKAAEELATTLANKYGIVGVDGKPIL